MKATTLPKDLNGPVEVWFVFFSETSFGLGLVLLCSLRRQLGIYGDPSRAPKLIRLSHKFPHIPIASRRWISGTLACPHTHWEPMENEMNTIEGELWPCIKEIRTREREREENWYAREAARWINPDKYPGEESLRFNHYPFLHGLGHLAPSSRSSFFWLLFFSFGLSLSDRVPNTIYVPFISKPHLPTKLKHRAQRVFSGKEEWKPSLWEAYLAASCTEPTCSVLYITSWVQYLLILAQEPAYSVPFEANQLQNRLPVSPSTFASSADDCRWWAEGGQAKNP